MNRMPIAKRHTGMLSEIEHQLLHCCLISDSMPQYTAECISQLVACLQRNLQGGGPGIPLSAVNTVCLPLSTPAGRLCSHHWPAAAWSSQHTALQSASPHAPSGCCPSPLGVAALYQGHTALLPLHRTPCQPSQLQMTQDLDTLVQILRCNSPKQQTFVISISVCMKTSNVRHKYVCVYVCA